MNAPTNSESPRTDDHLAVRRLLDAYADVVCQREWSRLGDLFDPSIEITVAVAGRDPIEFSGPAAFASFVEPAVARFDFFLFQILNAHIEFTDEDRAIGRTFMTEIRQAGGEFSRVYGRYDDSFTRTDGRWWFRERSYRTLARTVDATMHLEVF